MSTGRRRTVPVVAALAASAARAALGALWLAEGVLKVQAGFGRADILLVASGAHANSRVPDYFAAFAAAVLTPLAGLFGVAIPALELALGIALLLGVLTRTAALVSLGTLLLYWSSDQLIWQYPIMAALSAVVIAVPVAARAVSLPSAVALGRRRRGG